ncbi:MAG: hypothetical protein KTR30_16285 [Saprospiraceae bacterium]|nr:hypothetical protein [Saprospiraceae bacterium]
MVSSIYLVSLKAQPSFRPNAISQDTILMISNGVGMDYYMSGRKVNLAVMEWYMHDFPTAKKDIHTAVVSDQLSVAGYSVGSLFTVTGLLVYEPNQRLGNNLMMIGGISLGTGIIFQIISGKYKRTAVRKYNAGMRKSKHPKARGVSYRATFELGRQGFIIRF